MRHFALTKRSFVTLAIIALTCAAAPAAHAQTFYTTLSAYNAAATTATTYNFEGIAPVNSSSTNPAVLVTPASGRITFSVTGGSDTNVYADASGSNGGGSRLSDGSDSVSAGRPSNGATNTTIALGGSYTAFAIEYGMQFNETRSYTFGLFNGGTPVGAASLRGSTGGDNFFGATSATAFNNVRVTVAFGADTFSSVVFDNARVGSAGTAVVPEAGTLALLLPALGVLGVVVRRKVCARVH